MVPVMLPCPQGVSILKMKRQRCLQKGDVGRGDVSFSFSIFLDA